MTQNTKTATGNVTSGTGRAVHRAVDLTGNVNPLCAPYGVMGMRAASFRYTSFATVTCKKCIKAMS